MEQNRGHGQIFKTTVLSLPLTLILGMKQINNGTEA
jgi:hypothetical protein